MAWVLSFMVTFLPSTMMVLVCKLGFHTFLVWRCEKLTLLPYCLPLVSISNRFIVQRLILQIKPDVIKLVAAISYPGSELSCGFASIRLKRIVTKVYYRVYCYG